MKLYEHRKHNYTLQNVNLLHQAEMASAGFNQKIAMGMTNLFQAMPTFWVIVAWVILWITANATIVHFDPMPWPLLLALASVPQLPLMIVIMVGQGLLGRHQEITAEETYKTAEKTLSDIEQIMLHLDAQDQKILEILERLGDKS